MQSATLKLTDEPNSYNAQTVFSTKNSNQTQLLTDTLQKQLPNFDINNSHRTHLIQLILQMQKLQTLFKGKIRENIL